jgi:hypothetical protein
MTLEEKGLAILKGIANIRRKRQEAEELLASLERQATLMLSGVDPEEVQAYSYDSLTDTRRRPALGKLPEVWNVALLKDGRRVNLKVPLPRKE